MHFDTAFHISIKYKHQIPLVLLSLRLGAYSRMLIGALDGLSLYPGLKGQQLASITTFLQSL